MFAIKYRKLWLAMSAVFVLGSIAIISTLGLNLGIDFTGGALTEVVYDERPEKEVVELALEEMGMSGYSVRNTVADSGKLGYIVRTKDLSDDERIGLEQELIVLGVEGDVVRFTSIGPVIGQELKDKSVWAVSAVALIIVLYVAFAFRGVSYPVGSFAYGGITVLALVHDILLPAAAMSLMGYFLGVEVDVLFVMALLAVLGYSVNDTIVVFDRVRENIVKYRTEKKTVTKVAGVEEVEYEYSLDRPFDEIIGRSVSETLLRSINTSVTTLIALTALYVFGGTVTETFALILIVGVLAGTYSSIFLANPLLSVIGERKLSALKDKE